MLKTAKLSTKIAEDDLTFQRCVNILRNTVLKLYERFAAILESYWCQEGGVSVHCTHEVNKKATANSITYYSRFLTLG